MLVTTATGYRDQPTLPFGRVIDIPGRGSTFVREALGPPGAPVLMLLHGWSATADLNWHPYFDALSRHFRVIAIDHRGHGRSTNSRSEETYTVDHILDDVIDWLSHTIDSEPVDMLGHSMGGRVALRFALARREQLNSLILMDTTAWQFGFDDPAIAEMTIGFFSSITLDTRLRSGVM